MSQRLERSVHCPLHTPDGMVTPITFSTAEGCKYPLKIVPRILGILGHTLMRRGERRCVNSDLQNPRS